MTNDTIKIQARSADEVRSTNRVVLYKDGCEREFYQPKAEWEWCQGCKERDEENHCCHRWSKMIRKTVEEMQIVRCKDCKYAEYIDDVKTLWCTECGQGRTVAQYDFCSYAERRTE